MNVEFRLFLLDSTLTKSSELFVSSKLKLIGTGVVPVEEKKNDKNKHFIPIRNNKLHTIQ